MIKINLQTEEKLEIRKIKESFFPDWCNAFLRQGGNKLFLVMTGKTGILETPKELFVTSSITDLELWFENVNIYNEIYIQVFDYDDYKSLLGYLSLLYECDEHYQKPSIKPEKNNFFFN